MKLVNVLLQYDLWIVVTDDDDPEEVAKGIAAGGEAPNEIVLYPITTDRNIPPRVREERPFFSGNLTEEEYHSFDGATVHAAWKRLYAKED